MPQSMQFQSQLLLDVYVATDNAWNNAVYNLTTPSANWTKVMLAFSFHLRAHTKKVDVDLTPYVGKVVFLQFNVIESPDSYTNDIAIDDISVAVVPSPAANKNKEKSMVSRFCPLI
jgi:hypothetical protein